jgi:hypothetical protein
MQPLTEKILQSTLPDIVTDQDIHLLLGRPSAARRFGLVKRALAHEELVIIRRGLYILAAPYRRAPVDLFHVAGRVLFPSYVSLESALSAHGLIPELVHTVSSSTFKRSREFSTPLGRFEYRKSPFTTLVGVEHHVEGEGRARLPFLLASPLRALADLAHDRPQRVIDVGYLVNSLRIDAEYVAAVKADDLVPLLAEKPRGASRRFLEGLKQELGL